MQCRKSYIIMQSEICINCKQTVFHDVYATLQMQWLSTHPVSFDNMFNLDNVIPYTPIPGTFEDIARVNPETNIKKNYENELKAIYNLPRPFEFQKNIDIYSYTTGLCAIVTTNAFLNYEWLAVNCSKQFKDAVFICEKKHNRSIYERMETNNTYGCNSREILKGQYCTYLADVGRLSETIWKPHYNIYLEEIIISVLDHTHYLTAWTRKHENDVKPGMSSISVKVIGSKDTCLYTDDLFFTEVKIWIARPCSMVSSSGLHITSARTLYQSCAKQHFLCSDGTCILLSLVCDGQTDCPDDSDELICRASNGMSLNNNTSDTLLFLCRYSNISIKIFKLCDGVVDCSDNSDEYSSCVFNLLHMARYKVEHYPCPSGWSLCNTNGTSCYPNNQICTHTKTVLGTSLHCEYTEHLKFCNQHQCPNDFKVRINNVIELGL